MAMYSGDCFSKLELNKFVLYAEIRLDCAEFNDIDEWKLEDIELLLEALNGYGYENAEKLHNTLNC